MSGYKLGILNPDETLFSTGRIRESGKLFDFRDDTLKKLSHHQDTSGVFNDILNVDTQTGLCEGTTFRFRLRGQPSELSQTIYDAQRIHKLFEHFKAEGHLALIFLKNISQVEFYIRNGKGNATLYCSFTVQQESGRIDRTEEKSFMSDVKKAYQNDKPEEYSAINTIKITYTEGYTKRLMTTYFTLNHYAGDLLEEESELITKEKAKSKGYIPLVGIALDISGKKSSQCHIFCTLPLPVFERKTTGLPVHVNGFFAIAENRKDLKWLATGSAKDNDTDALWNAFLLEKVFPRAYAYFFLQLRDKNLLSFSKENMYNVLPDIGETNDKWQMLAKNTLTTIFEKEKCVYSRGTDSWLFIKDAFFEDDDITDYKAASVFLIQCHIPVVTLPLLMHRAMAELRWTHELVNPSMVRAQVTNAAHVLSSLRSSEREALLNYMLQNPMDISSLYGAPVIPLDDGRYASPTQFPSSSGIISLFMTSEEHSKNLIPGCEGRLIKTNLSYGLKEKMIEIAKSSKCVISLCFKTLHAIRAAVSC